VLEGDNIQNIRTVNELYVPTKIQGERMLLLFDTGAHITIITPEQYHLIPDKELLKFDPPTFRILQADGTEIKTWGTTSVQLNVGGAWVDMNVAVADVSHGVLGMDFVWKTKPLIDFGLLQLTAGGIAVPLRTRHDTPLQLRVAVSEDIQVPADHEMIIPAMVMGVEAGPELGLIEPMEGQSVLSEGFQVARSVVKAAGRMVPVRVLNVGEQTKELKQGTVLAKLIPVSQCDVVETRLATCEPLASPGSIPKHLVDLADRCTDGLNSDDTNAVTSLLSRYSNVFSTGDLDIGRTNLVKHRIDTGNARPVRQPLRRSSAEKRQEVERQVAELLDKKFIEQSDSPWSSPVVLVTKKDGTQRLCLDYRKLNDLTVKDAYPIPRIDDSLEALGGARWFSTLDLAAGYWQVAMGQDAKEKSAFSTPSGLYAWNVLPFGLCNAPSTFERLMERVLAGLRWETLLVYLDDIIVFGRTIAESIERLEEVFIRLRGAGLKLKPAKCHLLQKQVGYLGHVVSKDGIHTDPAKIDAVRDWPIPVTVTQLRSFLGLASYYRRFIKNFAEIASPLHRLTEKKAEFKWSSECDEAFQRLKQALISAPVLAYPQVTGDFIVDTDASAFAIGGVLSQVQDGMEKPIAYGSKSLKKAERNYCVTRRELLAVVTFLKRYRHYLGGKKVIVRTDHASLRWLTNFKDPEAQLARWLEVLSTFNMELEYRPGNKHCNADGLSRKPCKQCSKWKSQMEGSDPEASCETQAETKGLKLNSPLQCEIGVQTELNLTESEQPATECGLVTIAAPDMNMIKPEEMSPHDDDDCDVEGKRREQKRHVEDEEEGIMNSNVEEDSEMRKITSMYCYLLPDEHRTNEFFEAVFERTGATIEGDYETQSLGFEPIVDFDPDFEMGNEVPCTSIDNGNEVLITAVPSTEYQVRHVHAVPEITLEMIRNAQLTDKSMSFILEEKERGQDRPSWDSMSDRSAEEKTYWGHWKALAVKDGILVKRWESGDGAVVRWLTVLPKELRKRILDELHASPTAGHLGRNKTLPKIQERFFWVGMTADVRSYLKQCTDCARKKGPPKKHRAPLQQLFVGAPMERIAIDVLGPLTETKDGNSYILVVGDYHTKWMETYAIPDQQAETVASKLVNEFVCRFGVPAELHSDQGRNFESRVFREMCNLLNITKTRTTPYNPKSDGMVERYNRTIVNAVALMIQPHQHQTDWDQYLSYVGMAYRSSVQASTGETPNMMMTGREISLPVDLAVGAVPEEKEYDTDYAEELRERIRGIHERARHALKANMRRQKRNYDRFTHGPVFKVGKFVWLCSKQRRPGLSKKLGLPWEGPYLVVTALSDVTFRIQRSARSKPKIVHADRLKCYEGPELVPWQYHPLQGQPGVVNLVPKEMAQTNDDKVITHEDNENATPDNSKAEAPEVTQQEAPITSLAKDDKLPKASKGNLQAPNPVDHVEQANRQAPNPVDSVPKKRTQKESDKKQVNEKDAVKKARSPCKWGLRQDRKKPARYR
jgi:hypothetical protein